MNTSLANLNATKASVTCENCNLDKLCIPKGLNPVEVGELAVRVNRNNIRQKGEVIYHAGSTFRGFIALRSGTAKLVGYDRNGNENIVDFVLPGEILGFDGIASQVHNCTAIALEIVNFCHLPTYKIENLTSSAPGIGQILLQRSCDQYDAQVKKTLLSRRTAEERVAYFILDVSNRLKARGYSGSEFRLVMSREDIGNYLGIKLETVSRIFSYFQDRNFMEVRSKRLKIIDQEKLEEIGFQ